MSFLRSASFLALSGLLTLQVGLASPVVRYDGNVANSGHVGPSVSGWTHTHDHPEGTDAWCGTDFDSPEARAIMQQIMADRQAGRYPIPRKGGSPPDIGDRLTFFVSEDDSNGNAARIEVQFELVDKNDLYYLWADVAEIANGNVNSSKVSAMRGFALNGTPSRSLNPAQGVFANDHDIFGLPPNVDGDGIVDVLMYDIGRGSGNVIGYVTGLDQLVRSADVKSNERDILYVDSNEGSRNLQTFAAVVAHEYAHLINISYGFDGTFVSEGLAEYASIINGYYWRPINYMGSVFEVSQRLFHWEAAPNPSDERDYQRAGMFFNYIGERVTPQAVGDIMKGRVKKGEAGIDSVLALYGTSISDVILDFHTANYLNDRSLDPRFGYREPEHSSLHTLLTSPPVNGEVASGTGETGFELNFSASVNAGSVHYLRISSLADVSLVYDTPDPTGIFYPEKVLRNRGRMLLRHADGSFSHRDIEPGKTTIAVDGNYTSITFVLIHERPDIAVGDRSSIVAQWTPLSKATDAESTPALPTSPSLVSVWPNPFPGTARMGVAMDRTSHVQIDLYDMLGRHRTSLFDGTLPIGEHELALDAGDLENGTYLILMKQDGQTRSRTVTLLR